MFVFVGGIVFWQLVTQYPGRGTYDYDAGDCDDRADYVRMLCDPLDDHSFILDSMKRSNLLSIVLIRTNS